MKKPIGILGGTFDPIHFGHLRTAVELQQSLDLAEVRLLPCYQPVHRQLPLASAQHRLAMIKIAIASEPILTIDTCEIDRQGSSYMINTLTLLRSQLADTPLCLIIGVDALLNFPSWHRYQEITSLAHLIIVQRPQYQLPQTGLVAELLQDGLRDNASVLHRSLYGSMVLQPVTSLDISASQIRQQIASGKNPRFLLPEPVYQYIQHHQLYKKT